MLIRQCPGKSPQAHFLPGCWWRASAMTVYPNANARLFFFLLPWIKMAYTTLGWNRAIYCLNESIFLV